MGFNMNLDHFFFLKYISTLQDWPEDQMVASIIITELKENVLIVCIFFSLFVF